MAYRISLISRLTGSVFPKGHDQGKWWLITDLSFPHGHSVNDGIYPSLCSLTYSTVDEVTGLVMRLGCGALLAKAISNRQIT